MQRSGTPVRASEVMHAAARPASAPTAASNFETTGAALYPGAALSLLSDLHALASDLPSDRAGIRLRDNPALRAILAADTIRAIVARHLGRSARPVRAILFDKSTAANWALGWHQDRTIVVQERHDIVGYGPWSRKAGLQHVEPPFALIAGMLTLRVHLDDVPADNAPLLIAPGSHRLGRVSEQEIEATVARCGTHACLAVAGDVWAYATAIVHASAPAQGRRHRRVLQVDYASAALPQPLSWRGV